MTIWCSNIFYHWFIFKNVSIFHLWLQRFTAKYYVLFLAYHYPALSGITSSVSRESNLSGRIIGSWHGTQVILLERVYCMGMWGCPEKSNRTWNFNWKIDPFVKTNWKLDLYCPIYVLVVQKYKLSGLGDENRKCLSWRQYLCQSHTQCRDDSRHTRPLVKFSNTVNDLIRAQGAK